MSNAEHGRPPASNLSRLVPGRNTTWGLRSWVLLVAGAILLVLIAVVNGNTGNSPASGQIPLQGRPVALRPPTGLFAFGTSDSAVVISWQPPEPVPVGYRVYRASGHHGAYTIVGTVDAPNMDTFTDASSLVAGMTYAYTVTAFNRQGESTPAGPVFVVMLAPPQASPTVGVPTPLPTFVPLAAPTLTALAHLPKVAATPTSHANATPGVPALLSGTATAGVVGRLPTGAAGALPGTPTPSITLSTSTPIPTILSPGAVPTIVPTPQP